MKKWALATLTCLSFAFACVGLVACGGDDGDDESVHNLANHQHYPERFEDSMGAWQVEKEANCQEEGVQRRTCPDCGYVEQEKIEKTEHTGEWEIRTPAWCTQEGERFMECAVCYKPIYEVIPVLGHDEITHEAQTATCTQIGWNAYVNCSRCDYTTYQEIERPAHEYVNGACKNCEMQQPSEGLTYVEGSDWVNGNLETAYYVSGIGDCEETEIVIAAEYNGYPVTRIEKNAFMDCTDITSVTIPQSIKSISENAFKNCTALTEINYNATDANDLYYSGDVFDGAGKKGTGITVNIGANVTKIPANLFYVYNAYVDNSSTAPKITSVVFAEGGVCESIGEYAFSHCTSLTSIAIPDTVTLIDDRAFYDCTGLQNVEISTSVSRFGGYVFGGCTSLTSVQLPDSLTEIGSYTFEDCTSLTNVKLPNTISYISMGTFKNCFLLENVEIPTSVNVIEGDAFAGCGKLTSIVIPNSVTEIGESAFNQCASLTSVVIPNTVTSLGKYAFYQCTGLSSVTIPTSITSIDYAFVQCTSLANVDVPSNITSINGAFEGCPIVSITLPSGITSMDYAFRDCAKLESVEIPAMVTSLNGTFEGCAALESVEIPAMVTSLNGTFEGCTSLESVEIPSLVTSLNGTFSGCIALKSIIIPNTVTSIGRYSFSGCDSLTSITIPETITSIGEYAFGSCDLLADVYYNATTVEDVTTSCRPFYDLGSKTEGITIHIGANVTKIPANLFYKFSAQNTADKWQYPPKTVVFAEGSVCTSIGENAFYDDKNLTSIAIPASVTHIGNDAFYNCTILESVYMKDIEAWCGIEFNNANANPLSNAENLYWNDALVTELNIPYGVTKIGNYAFYNYAALTKATVPYSVTTLGTAVFGGSGVTEIRWLSTVEVTEDILGKALSEVTIDYKLATMDDTVLNVPSGYTSITYAMLEGLTNLKELHLPATVTEIEKGALKDLTSLEKLTLPFTGTNKIKLFGELFGQKTGGVSQSYPGMVEIAYGIPTSLTDVTVLDGKVSQYYFNGCKNITTVNFADMTEIGIAAFEDTGIVSLTLTDKITVLGNSAFANCANLKTVVLPKTATAFVFGNATTVGAMFLGCSALEELTLPDVQVISTHTFDNISGLTVYYYNDFLILDADADTPTYVAKDDCFNNVTFTQIA